MPEKVICIRLSQQKSYNRILIFMQNRTRTCKQQVNDCFFYVLNQTGRHFLSRFNILDKPLGISDIMLHNMDSHLFLYYVKCHHWTVFYLMVEYFVPSIVSLYLLYIVLIVFEWSMNLVLWQTKQSSVSFRFQIVYTCNVIILRRTRD